MVIAADSAHLERAAGEKEKACARAEKTPSSGVARARASRAFGSSAAAGGLGVVAKVDDVKHVEEDHALAQGQAEAGREPGLQSAGLFRVPS